METNITKAKISLRAMTLPLALAQFICSYAASNMNVAISVIAKDLGTSVHGVQIAITLFTLTMAALMIPGSKLTDIWGRKLCFRLGLSVYGLGALIAALAPGLAGCRGISYMTHEQCNTLVVPALDEGGCCRSDAPFFLLP